MKIKRHKKAERRYFMSAAADRAVTIDLSSVKFSGYRLAKPSCIDVQTVSNRRAPNWRELEKIQPHAS